jgi:putative ABC transport system ATP-binding protein
MVATTGLGFAYPGGSELRLPDLELQAGEQILVLGPSGSGKSTLLGLLAGLLTPKQGTIQVGDTIVSELSPRRKDHWRARNVGIVYQRPRLLASQSVWNNLTLQCHLSKLAVDREVIRQEMTELGIAHLAGRYPEACSIGEQQRIGILRALVPRPLLILADEPTSALDTANALTVGHLLQQQAAQRQATLIVVTHDDRLKALFPKTIALGSV